MVLYLIRHPALIGVEGLCYGRLEFPVNDVEITRVAASVRTQISADIVREAVVYSSSSTRCLGLARRLAAPREPRVSAGLLEMDFGDWQGKRWDSIAREEIDAWAQDLWDYQPGGGESATMVAARWDDWIQETRKTECTTAIAVTHAGIIRIACAMVAHNPRSSNLDAQIPYGSVHRLKFT
jgi:alpha-ribazole phosphatase